MRLCVSYSKEFTLIAAKSASVARPGLALLNASSRCTSSPFTHISHMSSLRWAWMRLCGASRTKVEYDTGVSANSAAKRVCSSRFVSEVAIAGTLVFVCLLYRIALPGGWE